MAPKPFRSERQTALDEPFKSAPSPVRYAPGGEDDGEPGYFPVGWTAVLLIIAYVFRSELFDLLRALA